MITDTVFKSWVKDYKKALILKPTINAALIKAQILKKFGTDEKRKRYILDLLR